MRLLYNFLKLYFFVIEFVKYFIKMDKEQSMYDNIMSKEVDMNVENEEDGGVKVEHIDCSDAFNTP